MKSINGIYHCQADSTDFLLKTPTFTGNASERTVTQLAKGGTKEQFDKVVDAKTRALLVSNKAREDLIAIRAVISTTCCTAMMDKPSVLAQIDQVIADLGKS